MNWSWYSCAHGKLPMHSLNPRDHSTALPSFSQYQHHETDAAKRKEGGGSSLYKLKKGRSQPTMFKFDKLTTQALRFFENALCPLDVKTVSENGRHICTEKSHNLVALCLPSYCLVTLQNMVEYGRSSPNCVCSDGHQLTKKVVTKSLTNFFSYTNSLTTFSSTSSVNSLTTFQLVTN